MKKEEKKKDKAIDTKKITPAKPKTSNHLQQKLQILTKKEVNKPKNETQKMNGPIKLVNLNLKK